MKGKNLEKGITLIALIITIIVLLILAGVTLNVVLNDNLIGKSESAANKYSYEQARESIGLALIDYKMRQLTGEDVTLEDVLEEIGAKVKDETDDKYEIEIDDKIIEIEKTPAITNPKPGITNPDPSNSLPVIETINVADRGTNYITLTANATDADEDILTYKLYLKEEDGTYSTTPNAEGTGTSGLNVNLSVTTGLSTYTIYNYKVEVTDGKQTVTSNEGTTGTGCDGTGLQCTGQFTTTETHSTASYCSGSTTKTCTSTVREEVFHNLDFNGYSQVWNSGINFPSNPGAERCGNCNNVLNYYLSGYAKCKTCGGEHLVEDICPSCRTLLANCSFGEYKYRCSRHNYLGNSSSHTYTANCGHGYSSAHYYCTTQNYKGYSQSHTYDTSCACSHGKYETHDYCSHNQTELHFPN